MKKTMVMVSLLVAGLAVSVAQAAVYFDDFEYQDQAAFEAVWSCSGGAWTPCILSDTTPIGTGKGITLVAATGASEKCNQSYLNLGATPAMGIASIDFYDDGVGGQSAMFAAFDTVGNSGLEFGILEGMSTYYYRYTYGGTRTPWWNTGRARTEGTIQLAIAWCTEDGKVYGAIDGSPVCSYTLGTNGFNQVSISDGLWDANGVGNYAFDNLSVTPEPTTMLLLAGGIVVGVIRRRK